MTGTILRNLYTMDTFLSPFKRILSFIVAKCLSVGRQQFRHQGLAALVQPLPKVLTFATDTF